MVITDKLVFLHLPKTGGTFVAEVLKKLRENLVKSGGNPQYRYLLQQNIQRINHTIKFRRRLAHFFFAGTYSASGSPGTHQHGTYSQIPEEDRSKQVFCVVRNFFDRYVSAYEFRDWVRNPGAKKKHILKNFPRFPDLTFEEYVHFENSFGIRSRTYSDKLRCDIGVSTYQFIQMFFRDPGAVIEKIDDRYIESEEYREDMPEIIFLRMENLNRELYELLLTTGYRKPDVSFILRAPKILPPGSDRRQAKTTKEYYTNSLYDYVSYKERMLFKLFPEYLAGKQYMTLDSPAE